jgi:hypothetical protein
MRASLDGALAETVVFKDGGDDDERGKELC